MIAALVGLAAFAPAALASSHFLKVSPGKVAQGNVVTVSGSVDHGCEIGHKSDAATIYSKAFKGATKHNFAGIPSVSASLANFDLRLEQAARNLGASLGQTICRVIVP